MSTASGIDWKRVSLESLLTLMIEFFLFLFLNNIISLIPLLSYYMAYIVWIALIALLVLVVYLLITKKISLLGSAACLTLVILSHFYFISSQPWCISEEVLFQVKAQDTEELLPITGESNRISTDSTKLLIIMASPASAFNRAEQNIYQCDWSGQGDGKMERTNHCSLLYRTGNDLIDDVVSVKLSQPGCQHIVLGSLFTSSLK